MGAKAFQTAFSIQIKSKNQKNFSILPPCAGAQEEMPRIRCSLLLCNWLIMGTLANCIITVCLHSLISQWLQLCCNKSPVTWDWSCSSDSASLKASDRHRPCSWESQGLWQKLVMNFSASDMTVAWKRTFSWEYATVQEGFIRRMYLWRKQKRKSISVLLESSWRKHRIGAEKPGLSAGTSTVGARQEIQIPQNNFSTPPWNLNSISSTPTLFSKGLKDPDSREISKTKPFPTWPHNGESSGSTYLWVVLSTHRCASQGELPKVQGCQFSTQPPSNKEPTCWPPPRDSV